MGIDCFTRCLNIKYQIMVSCLLNLLHSISYKHDSRGLSTISSTKTNPQDISTYKTLIKPPVHSPKKSAYIAYHSVCVCVREREREREREPKFHEISFTAHHTQITLISLFAAEPPRYLSRTPKIKVITKTKVIITSDKGFKY